MRRFSDWRMQVYFSHSYRDVPVNTYFAELFDAAGIILKADQKTDVWCMAKLERYMFEMAGFVSIIPRRLTPDESITYSPYIERELRLARRARTPRILFVDDQVLDLDRKAFPDAIPFFHQAPETELTLHVEAIAQFRRTLASGAARAPRQYTPKQATVFAGEGAILRDAASHVAAVLRRETFNPSVVPAATDLDQAFDSIDVFEAALNSELCVFVLRRDLSYSDVLLAMAYAHAIPSVRLRYDPNSESPAPDLSGAVRWKTMPELVSSFGDLLQNYQSVFATASGKEGIQRLATPEQISQALHAWDPNDGRALIGHIVPDDSYVSDRVDGVTRTLADIESRRVRSDSVCRAQYDRVKKDRFYYTFEPVLRDPRVQKIRSPKDIDALNCGTCIDFACLFASLLEAAHERPVVVVVTTARGAHAVAGYVTADAVLGGAAMTLGELRGSVTRGEIVLFETTGAVEAHKEVGAETEAERKEGDSLLDFRTAKNAVKRLLFQDGIELRHFVDVQQARRGG
jgi:hypothetical protein